MQVFKKKKLLSNWISLQRSQNMQIGFVPTMGALHEGHLSLVKESKKANSITVVSIFVNPTQFDKKEDLERYPKTIKKDIEILKSVSCDVVFIPSVKEMYTSKITSKTYFFDGIENEMEGRFRKGHFDGVATIVQAFLEIVTPHKTYFGEKDFQQLQIVKKLVEKENINVQIIGCPIFREQDGLAMSSRNVRLTNVQRQAVPFIYKTIQKAASLSLTKSIVEVKSFVKKEFNKNSILDLEYFTIANEKTLKETTSINKGNNYRAFIAVNVGQVRLIDNISIPINK